MTDRSTSSPLRIAEIVASPSDGRIDITFAPGKKQLNALSGQHDRDLASDLDTIAAWNTAAVVTLVEPFELEALQIPNLGEEVRRRSIDWHHWSIQDGSIPDAVFEAEWQERSARLRALLDAGSRVLVHCKGGLGRAGMIAARLLVEMGEAPATAIEKVRAVRPGAIYTMAQERWVIRGTNAAPSLIETDQDALRDRVTGGLLGLAVGGALGTTLEFSTRDARPRHSEMTGGGPFRLRPGEWTDDTSMALALADSLIACNGFDPDDLMKRFVAWWRTGAYSCTGTCFDIGVTTREALARYERTGNPFAGATDERTAGNGSLMRLAPVALFALHDAEAAIHIASEQSRTTHGAPQSVEACAFFVELLGEAMLGAGRAVLEPRVWTGHKAIRAIASGEWRQKEREAIFSSGYVPL